MPALLQLDRLSFVLPDGRTLFSDLQFAFAPQRIGLVGDNGVGKSVLAREKAAEQRRLAPEPAHSIEQGRPTKRGRRDLDDVQRGWGDRWSASIDDDKN